MGLRVEHGFPATVAALPAKALAGALGGPTLFDMRRGDEAPLFVSVLQHGNEVSGWDAARGLRSELLAASSLLFVGNVEAARLDKRCAVDGIDFNRVWEGGDSPAASVAEELVAIAEKAQPWLAVDVHNNTGRNPPYSVIFETNRRTLAAARAFSSQALLATQPNGVQTRRFARFCTALTIEVGTPDDPSSRCRAHGYLARLLAERRVPSSGEADDGAALRLFETAARVTVSADAAVVPQTQAFNFRCAPRGLALATGGALQAWSADGRRVDDDYLVVDGDTTRLGKPTVLGMYTADVEAARLDCLCYLLAACSPHG